MEYAVRRAGRRVQCTEDCGSVGTFTAQTTKAWIKTATRKTRCIMYRIYLESQPHPLVIRRHAHAHASTHAFGLPRHRHGHGQIFWHLHRLHRLHGLYSWGGWRGWHCWDGLRGWHWNRYRGRYGYILPSVHFRIWPAFCAGSSSIGTNASASASVCVGFNTSANPDIKGQVEFYIERKVEELLSFRLSPLHVLSLCLCLCLCSCLCLHPSLHLWH